MSVDYFSEAIGATVRSCRGCGCYVYGGPTICVPCSFPENEPNAPKNEQTDLERFLADATERLREELRAAHSIVGGEAESLADHRRLLLDVAALLGSRRFAPVGHDGDEDSGQCDPDCALCEWLAMGARVEAFLGGET